ncbi:LysR family transcriptional regulator [Actinoplanes sp. M2I2]|uniref:LysR family transcriptional regulator n=1 Tax=Actinoplanes sp. M2I2 TaxID=1734444 RepID=UPI002021A358|nr:LysR family transcriptional regulator [Actinoplanes sp. M2I2]
MPDVELRHLRYFLAVADERGFGAAAQRLTVTQSALSRAVAGLGRAVGVTLLDRTPRGVAPTAAGKVLADQARDILRHVETAVAETRRAELDEPPLAISCRGCDLVTLHQLIRAHQAQHPGDHAEAVETDWFRQLDDLRAGRTQIALLSGELEHDGLESEVLGAYERVALVSRSHPLAARQVVDRAELLPYPVVTWAGNSPTERAYWLGAEGVSDQVVAGPEVNDGQKLLGQVRLGTATAFLPRPYVEHNGIPSDVAVLSVRGLAPARVRLVWRADETSLAVARFVGSAATTQAAAQLSAVSQDETSTGRSSSTTRGTA